MSTKVNLVNVILVVATLLLGATPTRAAAEEDIKEAIANGLAWLVDQQDPDTGKWQDVPRTGFVLIKLQDNAYILGKDPFQTDSSEPDYYEYATNVIKGWEYLFAVDGSGNPLHARKENISDQDHTGGASGTIDDPDTRVNGYGIYFSGRSIYNTGICLMALASSRVPDRVNDGGIDYDGDGNADTFGQIAQDVVDWFAFAQTDNGGAFEGGFAYGPSNNSGNFADNSNSGYAYRGLGAAEGFNCTVPAWVKTELNTWITTIQDPVDGDSDDGGSWYYPTDSRGSWANELKTGNLIYEMTFYGDDPSAQRFQDAMDYIVRHWQGLNVAPGWKGDIGIGRNAHYQAMYCLMKGLEYSLINLIDLDGDNTPEHDWFDEFADVLLAQQNANGSWPSSPCYVWPNGSYGTMSGEILSTVWALLTLEKIAPPLPGIPVSVEIKPIGCPNPFNVESKGILPVAILGSEDFDVNSIDVASIRLANVAPLRSSFEDVAAPVLDANDCNCTTEGPDGFLDLTLKFETQRIVEAIGEVDHGDELVLELTGVLSDETPIEGSDCVIIRGRHKPINKADFNGDGTVDMADFAAFAENWLQSSIVEE